MLEVPLHTPIGVVSVNPMTVLVRPAMSEDYGAFCAILAQADRDHAKGLPKVFQAPRSPARPRTMYDDLLRADEKALLAALFGGRVVGFVSVELRSAPPHPISVPRRYGYVWDLVVDEPVRRQGVGRALMTAAEAWIGTHGGSECMLNVYAFNEGALAFYEDLGYGALSSQLTKAL